MKYYIATRIDRIPDHNVMRERLKQLGYRITYDWTYNFVSSGVSSDVLADICMKETYGVLSADIVFVLLPGGRGTHVELGIAIAAGKQIVIVESTTDGLLGGYAEVCPFYLHPCCAIVKTMDEAIEFVRNR